MKLKHAITSLITAIVLGSSLTFAADAGGKAASIPATYPLKKCVVSDEVLGGEMGKPVKVSSNGTDVYLCCKSCVKDFNKEPAKYVKMVKDAEAAKK